MQQDSKIKQEMICHNGISRSCCSSKRSRSEFAAEKFSVSNVPCGASGSPLRFGSHTLLAQKATTKVEIEAQYFTQQAARKVNRLVRVAPVGPPRTASVAPTDVEARLCLTGQQQQQQSQQQNNAAAQLKQALLQRDGREFVQEEQHPHQVLIQIFQRRGCCTEPFHYLELQTSGTFFYQPKPEDIQAYEGDLLRAVRDDDVPQLRHYLHEGRNLHCCNRFGEFLLHLAARKRLDRVVQFLIKEAKAPVNVVDDFGRTVLHDACWTAEPCFATVDLILQECPDLLLITDKRGHTPLFYARQEHWSLWMEHLDGLGSSILPRVLYCDEEESTTASMTTHGDEDDEGDDGKEQRLDISENYDSDESIA